jgi:hypothetical protein
MLNTADETDIYSNCKTFKILVFLVICTIILEPKCWKQWAASGGAGVKGWGGTEGRGGRKIEYQYRSVVAIVVCCQCMVQRLS